MEPETTPQPTGAPEPQPKASDDLKSVRTYQRDVEEMMQKSSVSKATIAIAEDKRRIERAPETPAVEIPRATSSTMPSVSTRLSSGPKWNMKLIAIVGGVTLVLLSGGIGAYVYFTAGNVPKVVAPPVKIPEASTVTLQGTEQRAGVIAAIQKAIQAVVVPQNDIRVIPIKRAGTTLGTADFFEVLETGAPATLIRALGAAPTLGVHGSKKDYPFLLFGVSSYDYAFGGMLAWEPTLLADIGPLFGVSPREVLSKVGSTTADALGNTIATKDVIIKNKDARAAFAPDGSIVFLYSFIDKQTLVFTTSEDTLKILINKAGGGRLR